MDKCYFPNFFYAIVNRIRIVFPWFTCETTNCTDHELYPETTMPAFSPLYPALFLSRCVSRSASPAALNERRKDPNTKSAEERKKKVCFLSLSSLYTYAFAKSLSFPTREREGLTLLFTRPFILSSSLISFLPSSL